MQQAWHRLLHITVSLGQAPSMEGGVTEPPLYHKQPEPLDTPIGAVMQLPHLRQLLRQPLDLAVQQPIAQLKLLPRRLLPATLTVSTLVFVALPLTPSAITTATAAAATSHHGSGTCSPDCRTCCNRQ